MTKPRNEAEASLEAALTARQARFVREYLVDLNGTQAAIRAGYAQAGAGVEAHRLLRNAKIASAIDREMARNPGVTRARIVDELAKIAFANSGDFFTWGPDGVKVRASCDLTDEQRAVVAEVSATVTAAGGTIRVKLSDKQTALEKLGRAVGLFRDRVELGGPDGGPIETKEVESSRLAMALLALVHRPVDGG